MRDRARGPSHLCRMSPEDRSWRDPRGPPPRHRADSSANWSRPSCHRARLVLLLCIRANAVGHVRGRCIMNRTALDQFEEALGLLRRQSLSAWVLYLAGAVPFTLAVLKLVHDMSSGYGAEHSVPDS